MVTGNGPSCSEYSTWRFHKASSPDIPDWLFLRPYINNNYLLPKFENFQNNAISFGNRNLFLFLKNLKNFCEEEKKNLGVMNPQMQEYVLIEDILYCMMSIEGTYIKKKADILDKNKYNYCIEPYLEAPTCGNYIFKL